MLKFTSQEFHPTKYQELIQVKKTSSIMKINEASFY